jgi:hypothetical protein
MIRVRQGLWDGSPTIDLLAPCLLPCNALLHFGILPARGPLPDGASQLCIYRTKGKNMPPFYKTHSVTSFFGLFVHFNLTFYL